MRMSPRPGTNARELWDMRVEEVAILPCANNLNPNWVSATASYLRSYDPARRYRSRLCRDSDGMLVGVKVERLPDARREP